MLDLYSNGKRRDREGFESGLKQVDSQKAQPGKLLPGKLLPCCATIRHRRV